MGLYLGRQQKAAAMKTRKFRAGAVKIGVTVAMCGITAGVLPGWNGFVSPGYADSAADVGAKSVSLDIAAADLHEVVHMLQTQTGADIIIRDGKEPYSHVNVSLNHRPLAVVLKLIATSANAQLTRDSDGVYIFQPLSNGVDETTSSQPQMQQVSNPDNSSETQSRIPANMHWQKLTLQHAVPHDILYIMHWDQDYREVNPFVADRYGSNTIHATNPVPALQVVNDSGVTQFPSVPIERGASGPTQANYTVNRSAENDSSNQAHQFPGGGFPGGGFNPGGGGGFPGGGGGFPGGAQGGFPGAAAGGAQGGGFPDGVQKIYALQSDNSLLVLATPEGFQAVKEIVKNLDISPRQVEIKVEFISAQVSDIDQLGISLSLVPVPGVTTSTTLNAPTASTFNLQYAAGNLAATLLAQLSRTRSKIVQAPVITTTNNTEGRVEVNTDIPYATTSTIIPGGGGTAVTTSQQNFLNVPTRLDVTPRINSDDTITLNLSPTITTFTATTGNVAPQTTSQSVTTLRTIRNGETMVLGGLITKTETRTQNRVPFFGDLPIIGNLFRDRNVQINDTELLIFVTATIIGEDVQNGQPVGVSP